MSESRPSQGLKCDVLWSDSSPTFRRNALPPSSEPKRKQRARICAGLAVSAVMTTKSPVPWVVMVCSSERSEVDEYVKKQTEAGG
jgi:hypothetical protein